MIDMPEWYLELTKNLKPKEVSPDKKLIIDYLRERIKELEG